MAFGPPPGTPGPFGPGGSGFPPPGGVPPFGGVVVHRARLVPRLILVAAIMGISFLVTGAIVWFSILGTADDVRAGVRDGYRYTPPTTAEVSAPEGWPEALIPPAGSHVVSAVTTSPGTPDEQLIMVVEVDGEGPAVADALRAQLTAAGLTIDGDAITPAGIGSFSASGAGYEASVAVSPIPGRPGITTVSWVLRPGLR
jgi:hypothetical protein